MRASRVVVWALAALAAVVGVAQAAEARKRLPPSPDYPGKCYDPELQLVLAPGASEPAKGECVLYQCSSTDNGFELMINSCGSVAVGNGCVLDTPNPDSPYPQCCPVPKC
ncbi:la1-like protein 13 [Schistocerca americana]|uniref:la1-like protein 13 n=1 Tax=Schistocerca americana TaxID=7009 RepID=UPI001F4FD742|nr:la1-like protein 13 [Schistocerca americana]